MVFCLTKQEKANIKKSLKNRDIDPFKLAQMTSLERRAFLEKYVGASAKQVNALFESKLLLKNQKRGYITWAKRITGMTVDAKRDIISRIERLDKVLDPKDEEQFLQDLASARLGVEVTQKEAKTISDLSNKLTELKEKANKDGIFPTKNDRLKYGATKLSLEKYVNELKLESKKISFKDQPLQKIKSIIGEVPGVMKSAVASLDNSFWGRQGIKTLLDVRTSGIWFKNFLKSFGDIGKEIKGIDAMDAIKADIYSRPNALNGKYDAGKYGLSVLSEEAYPSSWPEKIPLLGRLFKASESAYNGGALRLRADLADRLIKIAEKQGINTLDKEQAKGMGQLISSMTGRGSLGKGEVLAKEANVLLFSIKFLKSNIDTLTAHLLNKRATKFTKKEASKNLLSMVTTIASLLFIANLLNPDNVEEDPRSTNFGKIKIFGHWTDITGGMAGIITLVSRITPTRRNGEWGFWTKSSRGNWTNLTSGKYGQQNALDVFENFWEGKLSPIAGIVRDVWKGSDYQGQKVTAKSLIENSLTPISIQNYKQLKEDPNSGNILGSLILDGLGLSTSTYTYKSDWEQSTSKTLKQFKAKVGDAKFKKANDEYNRVYTWWYNETVKKDVYKKLSDDAKSSLVTKAKADIKDMIFKAYKFKYKTAKETKKDRQEDKVINKLLP